MRLVLNRQLLPALLLGGFLAAGVSPASAQPRFTRPMGSDGGPVSAPPAELKSVSVDEHIGSALPLDLTLRDEQGQSVKLSQYFDGRRPVVLQLGYFGCPMLCGLVSRGLGDSLKDVSLNVGNNFQVVYVSIDPNETPELALEKKSSYMQQYGRPGADAGWHLLTGEEAQVKRLAQAVGFNYAWVPSAKQYAHPAVLMVCTPDGKVSRYVYGVNFPAKTLRLSLVEASDGKVGSTADRFLLTCFQYDGHQGRYAFVAIRAMRYAAGATVLALGGSIFWMVRRQRRSRFTG